MNPISLLQEGMLLIRYGIVGVTAIAIQILFLWVWVSLLGLERWYLAGVVTGFLIALVTAFLLQKYWTFRDFDSTTRMRQFVWYGGIALGSLALNLVLLAVAKELIELNGVDFFAFWYLFVQTSILGVCALGSFLANRFITFRRASAAHTAGL